MANKTNKELTPALKEIYDFIVAENKPMIFKEIKASFEKANPSQLVALEKRGLIKSEIVEVEEVVVRKVKRNLYTLVEVEATE